MSKAKLIMQILINLFLLRHHRTLSSRLELAKGARCISFGHSSANHGLSLGLSDVVVLSSLCGCIRGLFLCVS